MVSIKLSPGGETLSGLYWVGRLVMGVLHAENADASDSGPVEPSVGFQWARIVIWLEQQSVRVV
ncbi:MAG: hypothetical protein WDO74_35675 [Pseudomonadota bacterium]